MSENPLSITHVYSYKLVSDVSDQIKRWKLNAKYNYYY